MSITHVASTNIIGIAKYNEIQSTIINALSIYGVSPASGQIAQSGGKIYAANQWYLLYKDINRCITHQTHNNTPTAVVPTTSTIVTVATVNALADAATAAVANVYNVGNGELQPQSVSSTRTTSWNNAATLHHSVSYDWGSDTFAGYFFAQGGYISASLSYPNGVYTGQDLAWKNLIDTANIELLKASYQVSRTNNPSNVIYSVSGSNSLSVSFTKVNGHSYFIDIQLSTTNPAPINIDITASTNLYISKVTSDIWGIAAPKPTYNNNPKLEQGQGPVGLKKSLAISPGSLSYSFYTGDAKSNTNTITITNDGTEEVVIGNIGFTNAGGVVPIVNNVALTPDSPPYYDLRIAGRTLLAGDTFTFTLAYSSIVGGLSNNSFTVNSDAQQGNITIPVSTEVIAFILSPSSYATTSDGTSPSSFQFNISRSSPYTDYSCSISSAVGTARGFTLTKPADPKIGPTVTFNAGNLTSDTYSTTLYVYVNGQSKTSTMTVALSVAADTNLATWISARGPVNSVVGISYDRIGGIKYMTVGVGLGADASVEVVGDQTRIIDLSTLGISADAHPELGPPLYDGGYDFWSNVWSSFVLGPGYNADGHGVVINQALAGEIPNLPITSGYITRSYNITLTGGAYTWKFSLDDGGWVELDGNNITGSFPRDLWKYFITGNIDISAGSHTLTLYFRNTGGPGAVAFQLLDSNGTEVWSTLTPRRIAYQNWREVYRIPLTNGNNATYLSRDYIVKDCGGAVGFPYGNYFPNKSIFSVTDNGYDNISITFNIQSTLTSDDNVNVTLSSLSYVPYYYTESQNRYTQLSDPINVTKTNYFLGFKPDPSAPTGISASTSIVNFPVGGIYTPPIDTTPPDYGFSGASSGE
jgi:hypothetical protein